MSSFISGNVNESFLQRNHTGGLHGAAASFYISPNSTSTPIINPVKCSSVIHMAPGSQTEVISKYGTPVMQPPSFHQTIPSLSGFQSSLLSLAASSQQQPSDSLPPVLEPKIGTTTAAAHWTGGLGLMELTPDVKLEHRRSETIDSVENPIENVTSGTPATMLASSGGVNSADRFDERGPIGEQGCRNRDYRSGGKLFI